MAQNALLQYLQTHYADAKLATEGTAISPIVVLSIGAFESGYGRSGLTKNANNHFGIKGTGNAGSVTYMTKEYTNGRYIDIPQQFAAYTSYLESAKAFVRLLSSRRYAPAFRYPNPLTQLHAVWQLGYATDPAYISKITPIVKSAEQLQLVSNYTFNPMVLIAVAAGIYLVTTKSHAHKS